ncbi:MAG: hypothetical protein MSG64_18930 [Pyrinomonadaceae bacterium MAG19_C2-C3]|nr:hypothetical protein [Pyrinomonadaceae bacterium MAG19_C2-C3]
MPMNKSTPKQNGKENLNGNHQAGSSTTARVLTSDDSMGGSNTPAPRTRRNPELAPDAEAKRAARRKALTLRALNTAYENHRGEQPRRKTA